MEWKKVEPEVWKPQVADHLIGRLVNREPKNNANAMSARYYLENDQGTFLVWGCAVLDERMKYVKDGELVRITYNGETKNK